MQTPAVGKSTESRGVVGFEVGFLGAYWPLLSAATGSVLRSG